MRFSVDGTALAYEVSESTDIIKAVNSFNNWTYIDKNLRNDNFTIKIVGKVVRLESAKIVELLTIERKNTQGRMSYLADVCVRILPNGMQELCLRHNACHYRVITVKTSKNNKQEPLMDILLAHIEDWY